MAGGPTTQPHGLTREAFEADVAAFEADVAAAPGLDAFCTSQAWGLSHHAAFREGSEAAADAALRLARLASGWATFAARETPGEPPVWTPLEAMWLLGCPLVPAREAGPNASRLLARELAAQLAPVKAAWSGGLWVSGLPRGPAFDALVRALDPHAKLYLGPAASRHVVSLAEAPDARPDFDAWYARRSAEFRKKTRQEQRRAEAAGLRVTRFGPAELGTPEAATALYARILAIEARSWKGQIGSGFIDGGMRGFYAAMLPRLARLGTLRALIGTLDGADVCFLFGGLADHVDGRTFRGLQMSYVAEARPMGLGNMMQLKMLQWLAETGEAVRYDLGSDMAYKQRWSDGLHETATLIARPR